MSRFRFRLQDLLRLREWREQQSAGKVAQAETAAAAARSHSEMLHTLQDTGMQQIAAAHERGAAAGSIQQLSLIIDQLEQHKAAAASALSSAEEELSRRMAEYTAAAQDRHMLDKLRERLHAGWLIQQTQTERKRMDEIAAGRHGHKPSTASQAEST